MKVPLIEIIKDCCLFLGDETEANKAFFLRKSVYLFQGLSAVASTGSTQRDRILRRNPVTRAIDLPKDFVQGLKIGFIHNGNFIGFGHNPKMQPALNDSCGNPIPVVGGNSKGVAAGDEDNPPGYDFDWLGANVPDYGTWGWGVSGMRWYGAASGWSDGYYRIDLEAGVIQFSSEVLIDEVWLRYRTTGMSADAPTMIYPQWRNAVFHGLMVEYYRSNLKTNTDKANLEEQKQAFREAKTKAISQTHGSTQAQMADVYRQTGGPAPRG